MKNPSRYPKDNPFRVPDGYFENMEDRVDAFIAMEESNDSQKSKVIRMLKPMLGLAASFVLVYLLVSYPLHKTKSYQVAIQSTEETIEAGEDYMLDVYKDILADPMFFDESFFWEALAGEETVENDFESDEIISIVVSEIDDYVIYAGLTY